MQVLDSRVNWACWAISQGVISPADLAPPDNDDVRHVVPAMRNFLAQLPAPGEPRAVDPFVGCEVDVRYLSEHVLDLLYQVRRQAFLIIYQAACHPTCKRFGTPYGAFSCAKHLPAVSSTLVPHCAHCPFDTDCPLTV